MPQRDGPTVGYVVKRYPRHSETFIVTEILAHEAAGLNLEIFALRTPCDTHFQDAIARVRAPVTYIPFDGVRTADFWASLQQAAARMPRLWSVLTDLAPEDARDVYQATVLAQHAVDRNIPHLHAHFATSSTSVARIAARMAGISYSFTAHAKDIYGPDVQHTDLRDKLAEATAAVTVSEYNFTHLRQTYGAAANGVTRIYNGLLLGDVPYSSPHSRAPIVLSVGRFVEKKGFADLVEACAILAAAGRPFTCDIIGGGPLEGQLREQIDRLGLASVVRLPGLLPRSDVIAHLREAAAFAAPCVVSADGDRDGLPTVLLEAMAAGTPCVATGVTGIPEIVQHDSTGLVIAERNPAELASALERLLFDPALRVRLATTARALIEQSFDAQRNAEQMRGLFHSAVTAPESVSEGVPGCA